MVYLGKWTDGESHPKDPENNDYSINRECEIWVNLNESRNDNPYELLQTVILETFTTIHTHFGQFGLVKPLS